MSVHCHSIFALSLTRFAFRNPNGITYGYATFDLLLQNSSITKRCFVILYLQKETKIARNRYLRKRTEAVKDKDY